MNNYDNLNQPVRVIAEGVRTREEFRERRGTMDRIRSESVVLVVRLSLSSDLLRSDWLNHLVTAGAGLLEAHSAKRGPEAVSVRLETKKGQQGKAESARGTGRPGGDWYVTCAIPGTSTFSSQTRRICKIPR